MKTLLPLSILLLSGTAVIAVPQTERITLKKSQKKRIELESNPTTGYSWYPSEPIEKSHVISLVKSGYQPTKTGLVGSGGKQFWIIQGKKRGTTDLILHYKRPWENQQPEQVKKFAITVE